MSNIAGNQKEDSIPFLHFAFAEIMLDDLYSASGGHALKERLDLWIVYLFHLCSFNTMHIYTLHPHIQDAESMQVSHTCSLSSQFRPWPLVI